MILKKIENRKRYICVCDYCGKTFERILSNISNKQFCNHKCYGMERRGKSRPLEIRQKISKSIKGDRCYKWNGGKTISQDGYIYAYAPDRANGKSIYVLEHRLVVEKCLGRRLKPREIVHHINGNIKDNRIENLRLFGNIGKHNSYHSKIRNQINKQER